MINRYYYDLLGFVFFMNKVGLFVFFFLGLFFFSGYIEVDLFFFDLIVALNFNS